MARQPKTSKRAYMKADRNKLKCPVCGNETTKRTIVKLKGTATWVCTICASRINKRNGV